MRKSLLAMAALMGVATLPAHAWRVKVDEQTFANIGFSTMIRGTYQGKRTDAEKSRINFSVPLTNITASGQVNKLVYFTINAESSGAQNSFITRDSFIGLKFADEFRVQAGWQRAPFSRASLTSTYALLVPTSYAGQGLGSGVNPLSVQSAVGTPRDAGVVVWGNVAEGMLKYYLAVTDGATIGSSTDDSLAYTVRLQFTPTMLGFKGETGYTVSDTYLGKQNVLSIGAGYRVVGRNGRDTKMWTVDALYEQKFGDIVPNLQVGYISVKDAGGSTDDASHIYAQGQLLYDQMVGFGKPALAVRFEQNKNKVNGPDPKNTRVGVWAHYYIKGQAAKVSLGVDSVNLNSAAKANVSGGGKNFTDVTLQFQVQF